MKKKGQQKKNNHSLPRVLIECRQPAKKPATWRSELSTFQGKWVKWGRERALALTICMENPEIPGRIQMESSSRWKFSGKSNTFRAEYGITFFPFLPKRPKFSVPFVWITSARVHVERKWKVYRYFVNGTTQSRSCFRCQKKNQYHLKEIFHRNFRTNGKRSKFQIAFSTRLPSRLP